MSNGANFVNYMAGGRFDPPFMPTKTIPYIEGTMVEARVGKNDSKLTISEDCELLSVAVGVSDYEPRDYWNLYVGNDLVCRNIYTKDVPEGMYLTAIIPCTAGTTFHLEYFNVGGKPKYVWVNYQMLK